LLVPNGCGKLNRATVCAYVFKYHTFVIHYLSERERKRERERERERESQEEENKREILFASSSVKRSRKIVPQLTSR